MKRKTDIVFTSITLLLGTVHIALTPTMYSQFSDEAHIFVGLGLAFLFLAFINFCRLYTSSKLVTTLCAICNMLCLVYLILPVIFLGLKEPQGFVAIVVVLVLAIFSIIDAIGLKNRNRMIKSTLL
jgi:hypothetical protein